MSAVKASDGASPVWLEAMEWFDRRISGPSVTDGEELVQPHWESALAAARKLSLDSNFTKAQTERLYADLLNAWTKRRIEESLASSDEVIVNVASTCLDQALTPTWMAPSPFFPLAFSFFTWIPVESPVLLPLLKRLYTAWLDRASTHQDRAEAALTWAKWAAVSGSQAKEAWAEVERVKKVIQGSQCDRYLSVKEDERFKAEALQSLEDGWKLILRQVEATKATGSESESESESEDDGDVNMS